jgi:hypothetical protein
MGLLDVQCLLALAVCTLTKTEPAVLARVFMNIRREEILGQTPEYVAARAYPAQAVAQFLSGLALPRENEHNQPGARPVFDVILGGLSGGSTPQKADDEARHEEKN